ncbi:hypothetical protein CSQ96_14690 [Janthinobacterium sp. BJB412]|nr:hypothetical protein CSQ96_14690 [Janthinobacterium sp. BJB412]
MAGLRVDLASLRARTWQAPAAPTPAPAGAEADGAAFLNQHAAANDGATAADTVADHAAPFAAEPPAVSTPPASLAPPAPSAPSASPAATEVEFAIASQPAGGSTDYAATTVTAEAATTGQAAAALAAAEQAAAEQAAAQALGQPAAAARRPEPPAPRQPPSPPPEWLLAAKAWLFGGNLVAKLGLLILFIGISFLLKYTAARVSVPIEFRLAGIVLVDIALLAWGWRIRQRRPSISLPVQGTALAVLMLVTFGAFRLYHLIPGSLAFALLFVLTTFTCVLAALQNAQWLALFGIVGGFAAPILASTGGGSHIGLFSYYALLNAGVFGLALLRSWRALNLLGFAFTFAIGSAWGVLRYRPEDYLSAQLFLLLFFLYYVAIALAYARRQAVRLKNYVDGTLIFGTPMLAFGLQVGLVRHIEFGLAYSALALGLFYVGLAVALRRNRARYALLGDTCLAIGVVFGTLTIPLALDGRWTSAAWALEGAGIVWVGLRQRQTLTWVFGLLVQAGAWFSFIGSVSGLAPAAALQSNLWLGFLLLAATAFLMATRFRAHANGALDGSGDESAALGRAFAPLAGLFLAVATVWLIAGAWTEIFLRTQAVSQANLLVFSALLTAAGLGLIAKRMAWRLASWLALTAQVVAGATLLGLFRMDWWLPTPNLFDTPVLGELMILAGALFSAWALMRQVRAGEANLAPLSTLLLLWSGLWWFALVLPTLSNWLATHMQLNGAAYHLFPELCWSAYCLLLAASIAPLLLAARRLEWPQLRWATLSIWLAQALGTLAMLGTLYAANTLPKAHSWVAYAALLLAGEWLLRVWPENRWRIAGPALKLLHTLRSAGPWLMIWPLAAINIARWLQDGDNAEAQLLADAGWHTDASWARFIPAWLMMAALAWLMQRSRGGGWPVAPIAAWYRRRLLPLACAWSLLLLAVWNLTQDGAMAPLPYLPLLNPLDLSSCFAMLLAAACYRMLREDEPAAAGAPSALARLRPRLLVAAAVAAYGWFNLALLRTVSHYAHIGYAFDALFASQFVQAMLSLVWSVTALLLMRHAAKRLSRPVWIAGAALLGLTVAKLFLVDLSNVGGVERIVSFLGVGALMVGIGYLAPYPSPAGQTTKQEAA